MESYGYFRNVNMFDNLFALFDAVLYLDYVRCSLDVWLPVSVDCGVKLVW